MSQMNPGLADDLPESGGRKDVDWEKLEREFRMGKMTYAEMSNEFGVNASTITRRAKKEGWTRDLSQLVRQETRAHISAQIVAHAQETHKSRISGDAKAVEIEAISNAMLSADHERVGSKSRALFEVVIDQIAKELADMPAIETLAIAVAQNSPEAAAGLRKVLALPTLVDAAKKATEGAAKAIDVERKSRNMDEADQTDAPQLVGRIELVPMTK